MPATNTQVTRVTYPAGPPTVELSKITIHSSRVGALESAVDAGEKYVPVKAGETLAAAIERYARERNAAAAGRGAAPKVAPVGRPVRDEPQA